MAIVTQTDKRTGITYAYETQYFWDKEKQQSLLDKLDVLECFEDANHSLRIGEMLVKQAGIYEALGVEAPTPSC